MMKVNEHNFVKYISLNKLQNNLRKHTMALQIKGKINPYLNS